MIIVRCPGVPKGGLKNAKRTISVQNRTSLEEVCYKVSLCENCQRQSCKAFIGLTNRAKMIAGDDPLGYLKLLIIQTALERNRRFSIFGRSDSAVTPSEKSSINTNRKSTTPFPMMNISYVVSKPPKGGSKMQGVQNLNNKLR